MKFYHPLFKIFESGSHNRTVLSTEPLASFRPSQFQATVRTVFIWPFRSLVLHFAKYSSGFYYMPYVDRMILVQIYYVICCCWIKPKRRAKGRNTSYPEFLT